MSIKKDLVVTYKTSTVGLSEEIELYRYDSGIDFFIDLRGLRYVFKEGNEDEMIRYTGATKYTITVRKPYKEGETPEYIETPLSPVIDRKIKFTVDKSMTDDLDELGEYALQIHLFNDDMDRMSIPPFTFLVKPLLNPDHSPGTTFEDVVDKAIVGISTVKADDDEVVLFSIVDGYIETVWEPGDLITASKLNKLEQAMNLVSNLETSYTHDSNKEVDTVKKGLDYLMESIDNLTYKNIAITFINISISKAELGQVLDEVVISWGTNRKPTSININGSEIENSLTSSTYNNISTNKNYTLTITDGRSVATKSVGVSFMNAKYYGASSSEDITSALINSLNKTLTTTKNGAITITANTGEYIYFAIPTRFGLPVFTVGGFTGGFSKVGSLDFTNAYGYTENYSIYRSDNHSLGLTVVEVS